MNKGKLIVFEGPDHMGKTTQIKLLQDDLKDKRVMFTREPGGFDITLCNQIRAILVDPKNKGMDPKAEAYLFGASRAEHVAAIKRFLESGRHIICDRYFYSNLVYQGFARGLGPEKVYYMNQMAIDGLYPDLIVYFKGDIDVYLERKALIKEKDRFEQEDVTFFENVIKGYDMIFSEVTEPILTINVRNTIEEIHGEILKHINSII